MRARKVDGPQRAIIDALRRAGCKVLVVNGVFDLLVLRAGRLYMLECKAREKARRTSGQSMLLTYGWPLAFAWDVESAYDACEVPARARIG